MSYNISRTLVLRSSLRITRDSAEALRERKKILPERHFLQGIRFPQAVCTNGHKATGKFCSTCGVTVLGGSNEVALERFDWSGICSGYDEHLALAAQYLIGEAEIVRIWEGGDSIDAIKIRDGKVTVHKVEFQLNDEGRAVEALEGILGDPGSWPSGHSTGART